MPVHCPPPRRGVRDGGEIRCSEARPVKYRDKIVKEIIVDCIDLVEGLSYFQQFVYDMSARGPMVAIEVGHINLAYRLCMHYS